MIVKELIQELSKYPDDLDVCVCTSWQGWKPINKVEMGETPVITTSNKWEKKKIVGEVYNEENRKIRTN